MKKIAKIFFSIGFIRKRTTYLALQSKKMEVISTKASVLIPGYDSSHTASKDLIIVITMYCDTYVSEVIM